MPAQSQQQQKLFGLALSVKRGETPRSEASDEVLNIVNSMSEKEIEDFASTSHSGLPTKVETQLRGVVREIMKERVLSEAAGKEAMGIAAFTATRGDAVQKFIDDNNLDAKKLFNYVKGGKLKDRMDFVTAMVGNPGNKIQKMIVSKFGMKESVNESKKMFSVHPHSVGSKKFDINVYDGRKNKDGSPFIGVVTANHNLELKDKIQAYKSKGYTEVDNVGKKLGVKYKTESVNEKVSPKDLEAIKGAVEAASSFMGIGSELKKTGLRYIFATSPMPVYIVQPTPNNKVAIVNKKYASKPDFVIGDTAVGVMENLKKVNELKKLPNGNFSIKKGYNTFADYEKNAKPGDTILKYDKRGGMIKTFVSGSELHQNAKKYLSKVHSIVGDKVNLSLFGKQGYASVPDYEKKEVGVLVLESINEASYDLGNQEYTSRKLTPTQILDLAMAYANVPGKGNPMYNNKMEKMIKVANDLAKLTGAKQMNPKARGSEPALILFLLKNKLVTQDEYVKLYKNLSQKHISVAKALKNADPASRMIGGAAARQAHKDMRGEFDSE
jgi:hypothetical protein